MRADPAAPARPPGPSRSFEAEPSLPSSTRQWRLDVPGWILVATLIFAPWAYGSTRPWTIQILNVLIFTAVGAWLVGSLVERRWPALPWLLFTVVSLLLVQGWWMTLNSGFSYDHSFQPHPRSRWFVRLPGAVDYAAAKPAMITITAMLGTICVALDLCRHRRWRKRFLLTLALTGVSISLLGLIQKVTHAPGIFWQREGHAPTFFGPYRYHANAGAYLNLVWPIVGAFLVQSVRRGASLGKSAFWGVSFVCCIAGALANTSRASGLIAVLMLITLGTFVGWRIIRRRSEMVEARAGIAVGLLLLALVLTIVGLGGLDVTLRRWKTVEQEFTLSNSRLMAAEVCLQMLPQSGWLGFGPGTFRTAFPFFNKDTSDATRGVWLHAHQDYLQTLVEWGWLGAALWAVLLPGVILVRAWDLVRTPAGIGDRLFVGATLAAVGSALVHAFGDFPLQIASLQLIVAVLTGLLWAETNRSCVSSDGKPSRDRARHEETVQSLVNA